jgi:hypothetical protein
MFLLQGKFKQRKWLQIMLDRTVLKGIMIICMYTTGKYHQGQIGQQNKLQLSKL